MQETYGIRTSRKMRVARIKAWEAQQERKRRARANLAAIRQVANATTAAAITSTPARW